MSVLSAGDMSHASQTLAAATLKDFLLPAVPLQVWLLILVFDRHNALHLCHCKTHLDLICPVLNPIEGSMLKGPNMHRLRLCL